MSTPKLAGLILFILLNYSFLTQSTQAATISLSPLSQSVNIGNSVSLDLLMHFPDDSTLGGGVDLFYDGALLDFVSFSFGSGLSLDPAFSRQPDDFSSRTLAELNGLGFGDFAGISGPGVVGTFTFNALAAGTANLSLAVNDFEKAEDPGVFFSAITFKEQSPDFVGATVTISAVPVPAAVWLFGSGLVGLIGIARRKKTS